MIKHLDITQVHATADEPLRKYLKRKIGRLDRYLPRPARSVARVEAKLMEAKSKDGNGATCEVRLHLPAEVIHVSETAVNLYAAIDIVELKLRQRITKYKELHMGVRLRHRIARRFKRGRIVEQPLDV